MLGKYITSLSEDELYDLYYKHKDMDSDLYKLTQVIQEICQVTVSKSLDGNLMEVIQNWEQSRLSRREEIANAIKEAEDQDLYEISEHLTSQIDLDDE